MSLKSATLLVAICLIASLFVHLGQWAFFAFELYLHFEADLLLAGVGLVNLLLGTVPLIIFFLVLHSKQNG